MIDLATVFQRTTVFQRESQSAIGRIPDRCVPFADGDDVLAIGRILDIEGLANLFA